MPTAIATQLAAGVSIYDDGEPASKEQQTQELLRSNKSLQDYDSHPQVQDDDLLRQKYPDLARWAGLLPPEPPPPPGRRGGGVITQAPEPQDELDDYPELKEWVARTQENHGPEPPPIWPLVLLALLTLLLLIGAVRLWKRRRVLWRRLGIPTVPHNVQRGLLRLYLVISVPWVAWFGFHILGALDRHRPVSGAVWSLLIVPIGGPLLYLAAVWVIAGFRMVPEVRPKVDEAPPRSEPPSHRPPADYYPAIARAVSGLANDTPEARQTLYDRARTMLIAQLHEHDQLQIECERRALEDAIRRVENQRKAPESLAKQPSTALLVASIILLSKLWVLDPTSMSLYWVARLPRR
jgi:hypothetical protein